MADSLIHGYSTSLLQPGTQLLVIGCAVVAHAILNPNAFGNTEENALLRRAEETPRRGVFGRARMNREGTEHIGILRQYYVSVDFDLDPVTDLTKQRADLIRYFPGIGQFHPFNNWRDFAPARTLDEAAQPPIPNLLVFRDTDETRMFLRIIAGNAMDRHLQEAKDLTGLTSI